MTNFSVVFFCVLLILLSPVLLTGYNSVEISVEDGVPSYFLEPEGYVIAEVDTSKMFSYYYGYISNDSYESYIHGTLTGNLVIKHPYDSDKEVTVNADEITSIKTGTYKDIRYKDIR